MIICTLVTEILVPFLYWTKIIGLFPFFFFYYNRRSIAYASDDVLESLAGKRKIHDKTNLVEFINTTTLNCINNDHLIKRLKLVKLK